MHICNSSVDLFVLNFSDAYFREFSSDAPKETVFAHLGQDKHAKFMRVEKSRTKEIVSQKQHST